jgi:alginate O-acetyltransferase complex protein AlgI
MNTDTLPFLVAPRTERPRARAAGIVTLVVLAGAPGWALMLPGWTAMGVMAVALFFGLKLVVLCGHGRDASTRRLTAFLLFWPGMNARAFLMRGATRHRRIGGQEISFACSKLALGFGLAGWAVRHADMGAPLVVGWVGMLGIIFTFHFGLFHVVSCAWRAAGVDAPPIMRAPILARSLAEFWGERWNVAFAEAARGLMLRPLARRWGVAWAGAAVFVASGIVHELVISLPARGGWGGPTLYFLLQSAGMAAEKSAMGRKRGLGVGMAGRVWTMVFTALPLPLLFHAPFAERVIVPLFRFLKEVL